MTIPLDGVTSASQEQAQVAVMSSLSGPPSTPAPALQSVTLSYLGATPHLLVGHVGRIIVDSLNSIHLILTVLIWRLQQYWQTIR